MRKSFNGDWVVSVPLKAGQYKYKFIVDGKWMTDPDNTERAPDGLGGFNSVLTVGQ
jgi:hypothetical protein